MHASSFDLLRDIACTEDQASNTNECDVTSSNKFMLEVGGYVGASLPVHSLPLRGPPSFEVKSGAGRRDGGTGERTTDTNKRNRRQQRGRSGAESRAAAVPSIVYPRFSLLLLRRRRRWVRRSMSSLNREYYRFGRKTPLVARPLKPWMGYPPIHPTPFNEGKRRDLSAAHYPSDII